MFTVESLKKIVFVCIAGALIYLFLYPRQPVDDAYISFRYAHNFSEGTGLCFNEGERVEGYTNLLWVLLLSAGSSFYPDIPELATGLSLVCALLTMLVLLQLLKYHGLSFSWQVVGSVLLFASAPFLYWSTNGLETSLFTFLVIWGYYLWLTSPHRRIVTGVIFFAAFLTRPDGLILFALLLTGELLNRIVHCQVKQMKFKDILVSGFVFASLVVAVLAWRYSYYESLFPNTYYAKVSGCATFNRGMMRLSHFLVYGSGFLYVISILVQVWKGMKDQKKMFFERGLFHAVLIITGFTGYLVYTGGDIYFLFRYYVPLVPLFTLFVCLTFHDFAEKLRKSPRFVNRKSIPHILAGIVLVALIAVLIHPYFIGPDKDARIISETADQHRVVIGKWMGQSLPPDSTLALNPIGIIPYMSRLTTFDMVGLTDLHIARRDMRGKPAGAFGHSKYDGDYILERQPDYILLSNSILLKLTDQTGRLIREMTNLPITSLIPLFQQDFIYLPGDAEIYQSQIFRRNYECWMVPLEPGNLVLFKNKAKKDIFSEL